MNREHRALLTMIGSWLGAFAVIVLVAWVVVGRHGAPDVASGTASPSASPSATTRTTATAAPDAPCSTAYTVTGQWPDGFGAELVVTSRTGTGEHWQLTWSFPADAHVTELWNATLVHDGADGASVQVTAPDWDLDLAAGESVTIGFNGARGTEVPEPTGITLDGDECSDAADQDAATPDNATDAAGSDLYVDPTSQAAAAASSATGEDRAAARRIAGTAQALWVVDGTDAAAARAQVADYTARADAAGTTGIIAVYAIPGRDCGSHSAGGADQQAYLDWVTQVADGITGTPWVVLEPDALAQLGDCEGQGDRVHLLQEAARLLDDAGARVYLDAGHSAWLSTDEAAARIAQVGTAHLAGFALNVSNYQTTADSRAYGEQVSDALGGLHYVVDTSRNGTGANGEWCNPRGRALGDAPQVVEDGTHLDAMLWVKRPGESDGTCNGGPAAGTWWPEIARELVAGAQG